MLLRLHYALSGTEKGYAATRCSDERVVVGTDTGDLLVVDGVRATPLWYWACAVLITCGGGIYQVELKAFIPRAPSDSTSIESVIWYSK
eukprot:2491590-Rhodomonas_salina.1